MEKDKIKLVTELKEKEVIICSTKEEALIICDKMTRALLAWYDGESYRGNDCWDEHKEKTCYYPSRGLMTNEAYCLDHGFKVYHASEFIDVNSTFTPSPEKTSPYNAKIGRYVKGTPCLVSNNKSSGWCLRYATGKGKFFNNGRQHGDSNFWTYHMELDSTNLPK